MQHHFSIGIQERHNVSVSFDQFWGKFEIKVDNIPAITNWLIFSFGLTKTWDLWVGIQEKHFLRIEKTRPLLFAAFQPHTYRFFIDGVLVQQLEA
jgi:hypothetical protein